MKLRKKTFSNTDLDVQFTFKQKTTNMQYLLVGF